MRLSTEQERFLQTTVEVLERRQFSEFLTEEDVSAETIQRLLESEASDLAIMGLYIFSLRQHDLDLDLFSENPASARNIARYVVAERLSETREVSARDLPVHASVFAENFEKLSARLVLQPHALAAASPVPEMTILVHGTWAASSTWWQPGGSLWNHINSITGNVYGGSHSFSWSGRNRHGARVQAANDLLTWIGAHPAQNLDIIAHSHGGNVCLLASRLGLKIRKLINLGTPIRLEYLPDLSNIGVLHNVFSTGDRTQTPAGTIPNRRAEGRTLGDSSQIINLRALDDGSGNNPGHSELHEPVTWSASDLDSLL